MKRTVKIRLIIVAIILMGVILLGYQFYKMVLNSEPSTGKQRAIPEKIAQISPITAGIADWTN